MHSDTHSARRNEFAKYYYTGGGGGHCWALGASSAILNFHRKSNGFAYRISTIRYFRGYSALVYIHTTSNIITRHVVLSHALVAIRHYLRTHGKSFQLSYIDPNNQRIQIGLATVTDNIG